MQAIREIKEIKDKKIVINLPERFKAKEAEIIILPIIQKGEKKMKKISELLLKGPVLSNKEIEEIKGVEDWFAEWKAPQF
jgi:hypothetical protein